jgi:C1A family cysteine protease
MKVSERFFSNLVSPFDIRDYKVAVTQEEFPDTFSLPEVTVKNQGSTGSCVAHACASVVEYHNKRQENTDTVFSTEFIYGYRPAGYYVGEGMYVRNALKTLREVGDCPLADLTGNNKCPEAMQAVEARVEELKDKAYPHRISTYARVNTAEEIKQALMNFGYVVVSMPWHKDYKLRDGVYTYTSNDTSGYHCVVIYGWDERGWLVQNSWGSGWGKKGKFVVPFDFKWIEAWAVTDEIKGEGDIIRPDDNWFVKTFAPIINAIANFFRKLFKKI